jgi:ribosome recycling factor
MTDFNKLCKTEMEKKLTTLDQDLARVRTGRASVTLLDGIKVDFYGTPTPINQVASISTPDARTIVISPFDKKSIQNIERAIQVADVGIQPNNDGNVIRLPVPPLNEQRRKDIAKQIHKMGEDVKVAIRKVRQDLNTSVKKEEKDKILSEDDSKKAQEQIQKHTDAFCKQVDEKVAKKEKEILTM